MPPTTARTPDEYIAPLPDDRRESIARTDLDRYLEHYAEARGSSRQTRKATSG